MSSTSVMPHGSPAFTPQEGRAPKVLFLDDSLVYENDRYYNLAGPRLLAAAIKFGGASPDSAVVRIHDKSDPEVVELVRAAAPDVVGLSAYVWNIERFLRLAPKIKASIAKTFVVMGGPSASALVRSLYLGGEGIDLVVAGEGEECFTQILAGRPGHELPGVYWLDGDAWRNAHPLRVIEHLDALPSPYGMDLLHEMHVDPVLFEFSRGCPFRCSYCSWPSNNSRVVRSFGAQRMLEEVSWAVSKGVRHAWMLDAAINYSEDIFDDILDAFEQGDPAKTIGVFCFLKFEFVRAPQVERMARFMNIRDLHMPFESTSRESLQRAHRPFDAARFEQALALLKAQGINPSVELLLGLPFDTLDGFRRSVDYALSKEMHVNVFNVVAYPGSEIFDKRAEYGIELAPGTMPFILSTPQFPRADMERARELVRQLGQQLESDGAKYTLRMEAAEALHKPLQQTGARHAHDAFGLQ